MSSSGKPSTKNLLWPGSWITLGSVQDVSSYSMKWDSKCSMAAEWTMKTKQPDTEGMPMNSFGHLVYKAETLLC